MVERRRFFGRVRLCRYSGRYSQVLQGLVKFCPARSHCRQCRTQRLVGSRNRAAIEFAAAVEQRQQFHFAFPDGIQFQLRRCRIDSGQWGKAPQVFGQHADLAGNAQMGRAIGRGAAVHHRDVGGKSKKRQECRRQHL